MESDGDDHQISVEACIGGGEVRRKQMLREGTRDVVVVEIDRFSGVGGGDSPDELQMSLEDGALANNWFAKLYIDHAVDWVFDCCIGITAMAVWATFLL